MRLTTPLIIAATFAVTTATAVAAQRSALTVSPQWHAFLGCWEPAKGEGGPTRCVVPTESPAVVEMLQIVGGKITARERLDASGSVSSVERGGCTTTEQVTWSADGRRGYISGTQNCGAGLVSKTRGVIALSVQRELVYVRGTTSGKNVTTGALRLYEVAMSDVVSPEAAQAIGAVDLAIAAARDAAAVPAEASDVIDVSRAVDVTSAEAWVLLSRQELALDAKSLITMADAGVPGSVTDLLVAVANPEVFVVDTDARTVGAAEGGNRNRFARGRGGMYGGMYGGSAFSSCMMFDPFMGYGMNYGYRPFCYDPYGMGYGGLAYGYGYGFGLPLGGYGYGFPGYGLNRGFEWGGSGYYGGVSYSGWRPVVVVPADGGNAPGRMVKGRGYTTGASGGNGAGSGGNTPIPRPQSSGSSGGSAGSSGGSAGSSGGNTNSPPPPSSGRTAKPRP